MLLQTYLEDESKKVNIRKTGSKKTRQQIRDLLRHRNSTATVQNNFHLP